MTHHTPALPIIARSAEDSAAIQHALDTIRETLGMEVAYLSEFVEERAVFRAVSAPGLEALIQPSQAMDLREVYCKHIIDGRLPQLMTNTSAHPIAVELPITQMIPIGSHLSVPVQREDGSIFGMFCFLSRHPRPDLGAEDLALVQARSADVAARIDGLAMQAS